MRSAFRGLSGQNPKSRGIPKLYATVQVGRWTLPTSLWSLRGSGVSAPTPASVSPRHCLGMVDVSVLTGGQAAVIHIGLYWGEPGIAGCLSVFETPWICHPSIHAFIHS